jgi:hypothetical protein
MVVSGDVRPRTADDRGRGCPAKFPAIGRSSTDGRRCWRRPFPALPRAPRASRPKRGPGPRRPAGARGRLRWPQAGATPHPSKSSAAAFRVSTSRSTRSMLRGKWAWRLVQCVRGLGIQQEQGGMGVAVDVGVFDRGAGRTDATRPVDGAPSNRAAAPSGRCRLECRRLRKVSRRFNKFATPSNVAAPAS